MTVPVETRENVSKTSAVAGVHAPAGSRWHPARFLWDHPEGVFVASALIFGLIFVFLTPPFQVPDEPSHFYRAYQVSEGRLLSRLYGPVAGGYLPASLVRMYDTINGDIPFHKEVKQDLRPIRQAWRMPLHPKARTIVEFANTAIYSPVAYVPQAIGIAIGRLLGHSPLLPFYTGRIANLLVWIALMVLVIHLLPFGKWLVVVLNLMPMSVSQAASHSADGVTNGLAFLFIALALSLALRHDKPVTWPLVLALALLAAALGMLKVIYLLVVGTVLCIPFRRFASLRAYLASMAIVLGSAMIAWYGWYVLTRGFIPLFGLPDQVRPDAQLHLLMQEPSRIPVIVANTLQVFWQHLSRSFIGVLGWLDTSLPDTLYCIIGLVLLFATIASNPRSIIIAWWQRLLMAGCFALCLISLHLIVYLYWTPYQHPSVLGLQGRHFMPFVPLLFFPFVPNRAALRRLEQVLGVLIPLLSAAALAVACVAVFRRYY